MSWWSWGTFPNLKTLELTSFSHSYLNARTSPTVFMCLYTKLNVSIDFKFFFISVINVLNGSFFLRDKWVKMHDVSSEMETFMIIILLNGRILTISNCYGCKRNSRKIWRCKLELNGVIIFPINSFLHPEERNYIFPGHSGVIDTGIFLKRGSEKRKVQTSCMLIISATWLGAAYTCFTK